MLRSEMPRTDVDSRSLEQGKQASLGHCRIRLLQTNRMRLFIRFSYVIANLSYITVSAVYTALFREISI